MPTGVTQIEVEVWGGGGGGGADGSGGNGGNGGGGGAGGLIKAIIPTSGASTCSITVGIGGVGDFGDKGTDVDSGGGGINGGNCAPGVVIVSPITANQALGLILHLASHRVIGGVAQPRLSQITDD